MADLNEERLCLLARRLGRQRFVSRVDTFPREKPDRVVARFVPDLYPEPVDEARLELRLWLSDDASVQYVEAWNGDRWPCRWDRHDNDHNDREHFHPPPDASVEDAVDGDLPDDSNQVVALVLGFVEERISDLWTTEDPRYPSEYEYRGEYPHDG